jgi:hypothetical protein
MAGLPKLLLGRSPGFSAVLKKQINLTSQPSGQAELSPNYNTLILAMQSLKLPYVLLAQVLHRRKHRAGLVDKVNYIFQRVRVTFRDGNKRSRD